METIQHLTQQLEEWEDMQGIDDEEDEQEWIQAGITLYEKCIQVDKENKSEYLQALSRLYLNLGRNEKMKFSNFDRAVRILKQATYIDPKDPRPCYHLSFLLEKQNNDEGALFYAERAIKLGLDDKATDKLYCNMALCYFKLLFVTDAYQYLLKVEEKAKHDPTLAIFLKPYQAKIKVSKKKGYVPLSQQHGTLIETEEEIENSVSNGERVVLIIHPYQTELNGEVESVPFSPVNTQILEAIMLSEEGLSIPQIADVLWGYNSIDMSDSYVPRMINKIRSDIKKATGIEGKQLLKTAGNKYLWDHERLKGSIHYRNRRRGSRSREGITIL
ncbi:tetratricopeptide repeat protein [Niallia sp. Krafla_26]|uniref:tetratricopeptide repeat protein n=1 Tax=Niallia sp. Krafla_26 TaxID=3064703 RepID=UPI003D178E39